MTELNCLSLKIEGITEDIKFFKNEKKNDSKNSKHISRTFSGVVVGSVGSVHFSHPLVSDSVTP